MTPRELVVGLLALGSVAFVGLAAVGLLRLPDCYARAHAASKADTLGALAAFAAVGVAFDLGSATAKAAFLAVFVLATTPVATHAVVRTAYQSGLEPETTSESREVVPESSATADDSGKTTMEREDEDIDSEEVDKEVEKTAKDMENNDVESPNGDES